MKPLRILLVEDDAADARMIRDMLSRTTTSFELVHVATIGEAGPVLATTAVDVVLLDLSLPDAVRLESLARLHAIAPVVPIIVLTGNDDVDIALEAVGAHAQDYLVKWDFNAHILVRSIRYAGERQRIQDQLRHAKNVAEAATRAKSEFLANMSHEIRTPMNAILGMADLLAGASLDDKHATYLRTLRHAGEHLLALVDDVLDLARLETGGMQLAATRFDLRDLVERTAEFLAVHARERRIELRVRLLLEAPSVVVGDPKRLRQVLVNLIGNAIKFTDAGHVEVAVVDAGPDEFRFSVADTGIGIDPDYLAKIFERFGQADSSITRERGGSGLGLAIAASLVELMDGRISVDSEPHRGSTFTFTARLPSPQPCNDDVIERRPRSSAPPPHALRVLLADDDDDSRFLIESYFRDSGHRLDVAKNGALATEQCARARYDLVLMDMHMPVMDGLVATRSIRAAERERGLPPMPIIALTADVLGDTIARSEHAGCTSYLTKPIKKEILFDAVCRYATPQNTRATTKIVVDRALLPLMPRFIKNRENDAAQILDAANGGDFERIWTLGHNMQGTGRGYELPFVGELGAALAKAATNRDREFAARLANELAGYLATLEIVCRDDG